jgi:hypothetical protein
MVPAWVAAAVWFIAWSVLAWLSIGLLQRVRPGETVPMRRLADGTPGWRVAPGFAAVFTPGLATLVGLLTIVASLVWGHGRAPVMNVFLAAVFVAAHWMQISMAVKVLEKERGDR